MTRNIIRVTVAVSLLAGLAPAEVLINGAGASFPYPMYSKWFDSYHKKFKDLNFNYQSIGSSGGIKNITDGTVDFGASDGPMTDEQLKAYRDKHGFGVLHFPTVLGAVVPIYNVPGVAGQLNFTGEALAGIFLGKITKWNDPELVKANPGVNLPANNIVVVHRAEGSGTTYVWTDYLSKVSPEWKTKVGTMAAPNWPVGLGGKGSEGVAGQVKQVGNSMGYVELIYAVQNKISYGKVKNSGGVFMQADLASVTAAAARTAKEMPDDFRVSITNAAGKDAYPISTFTWLLIPEKIADGQKKKAIVDFLKWMMTEGQSQTEALDYAQLPKPVVDKEAKAIAKIQ
jgi:phosphate transport system substrate-binding protein